MKSVEGKVSIHEVTTLIEQSLSNEAACRQCNRTFNALTETPLSQLRYKDKWVESEQAMIQGLSLRQSADSFGITKNTRFKVAATFFTHTCNSIIR